MLNHVWCELQILCNKDVFERQNKIKSRIAVLMCYLNIWFGIYYFVGWPWTTPQQHQRLVSYESFLRNRIYVCYFCGVFLDGLHCFPTFFTHMEEDLK